MDRGDTGPGLPDPVESTYAMFVGLLQSGQTCEQAQMALRTLIPDTATVEAAVARFKQVTENLITAREPETLVDRTRVTPWYTGVRQGDRFWPSFRDDLRSDDFDAAALNSLDVASTKVVAHLPPPWKAEFSGRGLVLGYVQSGKTSNFTAVISKAADAGYRLFIVLSGIHNNLRRQTQARLDRQLVDLNSSQWIRLTNQFADFGQPGNADALMSQNELRILAVVKKHKMRLRNLIDWLDSASQGARRNCPIMVIDDEADQASINTKSGDARAVINDLVIELLAQPKVAYVGYTATPFANIFIDPAVKEDLYPRDFILDLPRPPVYFGPERIFGREPLSEDEDEAAYDGLDMVRLVPDDEASELRPPRKKLERMRWDPVVTASLSRAIRYFLLATAARRARGHVGHSSMLLHTTQYADAHVRLAGPIEDELNRVGEMVAADDLDQLRRQWEGECESVPATSVGETPVSFGQVVRELSSVVADGKVVIDNYLSEDRLDYGREPQVVIVVGGNTLSRGLTLEGLVVSFFLRTASAYDTLLQMGRWFGYRGGYSDLPRIWLTKELSEYFQFLATVEAEIRVDVARYEKEELTPQEFAVRVQTHPKLAITSALKMQAAVDCQVSYSDRRIQTILFDHRSKDWLGGNLAASRRLLATSSAASPAQDLEDGRRVWRNVDVEIIDQFLADYAFHVDAQDLNSDRIREYIARQNGHDELTRWNVGLVTRADRRWGTVDLGSAGSSQSVGLINRAAMAAVAKPHANIKSLMSHADRVMDLGMDATEVASLKDDALQGLRSQLPGTGLLILYPINKDSIPRKSAPKEPPPDQRAVRVPLNAVEHVIGVGLVFPKAAHPEAVRYKAVALALGDVEGPEEGLDAPDTEPSLDEVAE